MSAAWERAIACGRTSGGRGVGEAASQRRSDWLPAAHSGDGKRQEIANAYLQITTIENCRSAKSGFTLAVPSERVETSIPFGSVSRCHRMAPLVPP
jgi:hypothetical protein